MVTIPRLAQKGNAEIPTTLHGLQLMKNDKGKSEEEIRKKEANKADKTGLTCESTKMNRVISMYNVPVKLQSKVSKH